MLSRTAAEKDADRVARRTAAAPLPLRSVFDGAIVLVSRPVEEIVGLLPQGLVPVEGRAAGSHPLLVVFGRQSRCAMRIGGRMVERPRGFTYGELGLIVPRVRSRVGGRPLAWVPLMRSSDPVAVWSGRRLWGFGKQRADMGWHGPIFAARDAGGLLFEARVALREGARRPGREASDAWLRALSSQPMLSRLDDGRFVRARFAWRGDGARMRPVRAHLTLHAGLGLGERRMRTDPAAGFLVEGMRWELGWPQPARLP